MSYTFTIPDLPGGMTITCTAATERELIREAYVWQQLPTYCPIDGTATVFDYRDPKGNKYYGVVSTGYPAFRHPIRQHKEGGGLYTKDEWYFYDGEQETLVWASGKITPAGQRIINQNKPPTAPVQKAPPAATNGASAPPPVEQAPPAAAPFVPPSASADHSRLDGLIHDLGDLLYGDDAPPALAAICRQHTEQKRSRLEELTADQKGDVLASLRLRQKLHSMAAERWGEKAIDNIQRNALRITGDFTDKDAELRDEQVEAMIHGIEVLNANDRAKAAATEAA